MSQVLDVQDRARDPRVLCVPVPLLLYRLFISVSPSASVPRSHPKLSSACVSAEERSCFANSSECKLYRHPLGEGMQEMQGLFVSASMGVKTNRVEHTRCVERVLTVLKKGVPLILSKVFLHEEVGPWQRCREGPR